MTEPNAPAAPVVLPLAAPPRFLTLGAWRQGEVVFEVAGRSGLDSRVLLPFFRRAGALWVGLVERERASRAVRGAPLLGLEGLSHDFRAVDETADIRAGAERLLTTVAGLRAQPHGLQIPLPSFARSIGYLSELCLPLLVPVEPPSDADGPLDDAALAWGIPLQAGVAGTLRFLKLEAALALLDDPDGLPLAEELQVLLRALAAPPRPGPERDPAVAQAASWWSARGAQGRASLAAAGDRLLQRSAAHVVAADALASLPASAEAGAFVRVPPPAPLRFLKLSEVRTGAGAFEVVTPASNVALTLLPMVQTTAGTSFLLWREVRPAALERQARAPLFDLPVPARYLNATGFFLPKDAAAQVAHGDLSGLHALAPALLARVLGAGAALRGLRILGRPSEPAPGLSSELRVAAAALLDPDSVQALPTEAVLLSAAELAEAIAAGQVRDPVVVYGLLALAPHLGEAIDPFGAARSGVPGSRAAFLEAMTRGSEVQRRLQGYSSIEAEQLQSPTYARLMTLLQHEYGLRIAYPKTEKDRGFFKAAFRVFMAADRGSGEEDRALQGLHWSHDAYHFALGNFLVPPPPDFEGWYIGGAPAPAEQPPEGPAWDRYSRALKAAENEATFFSFWTLYDEHLPLARHVGKLTFFEALRDLGITARPAARAIYDDVVDRAVLPESVKQHPVYQAREDIRGLFAYMLGFRAYHYKDIAIAWRFGAKDPYRGYLARFGIYESDLGRYLARVAAFWDALSALPRGLNPLLCALADVRLDLQLRVWDVTKALRLLRAATLAGQPPEQGRAARTALLGGVEPLLGELEQVRGELAVLRLHVHDAEATPRNQALYAQAAALGAQVESVRDRLWGWAAGTGLLSQGTLDEERVRELPR
jgi:hypothetical protein